MNPYSVNKGRDVFLLRRFFRKSRVPGANMDDMPDDACSDDMLQPNILAQEPITVPSVNKFAVKDMYATPAVSPKNNVVVKAKEDVTKNVVAPEPVETPVPVEALADIENIDADENIEADEAPEVPEPVETPVPVEALDDIETIEADEAPQPVETPVPVEAPESNETIDADEAPAPVETPVPVEATATIEVPKPVEAPKPLVENNVKEEDDAASGPVDDGDTGLNSMNSNEPSPEVLASFLDTPSPGKKSTSSSSKKKTSSSKKKK